MLHAYHGKELKRLFGLSASVVRSLARAGHIHPVKTGDRAHYSFQDLLILRMVSALIGAKIPLKKIDIALKNIRSLLPGATLNGFSMRPADGADAPPDVSSIGIFKKHHNPNHVVHLAQRHFERALAMEDKDPNGALAAYRESLAIDAHHVEARINLGRLLHLGGEHDEAEKIYRAGLTANAVLAFNLALLLEDLDRESEAILAYREALAHDPSMADAHFNLARLHEQAGRPQDAFRHLLAYRRLTQVLGIKKAKRKNS